MMMFVQFFQRAVMQGIPLLFGATGEILTEKSGHLNLGIPGIMYVGAISGVIGSFFYETSVGAANINPFLAVLIPLLTSILGSLIMGLIYCFLTVTLRANQNVTGLTITTFGVAMYYFIGNGLGTKWPNYKEAANLVKEIYKLNNHKNNIKGVAKII